MFIRVHRLKIQSVMLVFSTQLCELLPSALLPGSTLPPHPFHVCISILYTRIQCVMGVRYGVLGLRQTNICRKFRYRSIFLDNDIVLAFYESYLSSPGTNPSIFICIVQAWLLLCPTMTSKTSCRFRLVHVASAWY